MRILFVCVGDPSTDPRIRKELQHLRSRGFDDIGVMALFTHNDANVVCWHDGFVDRCPLFRVNSRAASHVRQAVLGMKPDVVHVHELDALWPVLTSWGEADVQAVIDGSSAAESGVSVERLPMRMIYEAHEYERGRYNVKAERIQRAVRCSSIADEIIHVSPAIVDETERVVGRRPHLIPNSFMRRPRPIERGRAWRAAEPKPFERVVSFCGNVTVGRGLDVLAEAMRILGRRWKLVVMGDVKDASVAGELQRGNDVRFIGRAPYPYPHEKDSIVEWIAGVDVGINVVDTTVPSYRMALPNKLFEYGFSGVPIVSNHQVDVVSLTREFDLGRIANVSGRSEDLEIDAPRLAAEIAMAAEGPTPKTDEFIDAWCWEETGGKVMDLLYL